MTGSLSFLFYLLSLLGGALSIGIAAAYYRIHVLKVVRWYALILAAFLDIVFMLTVQIFFRLSGAEVPAAFGILIKALSVAGPCLLVLSFPCFISVAYSIRTSRGVRAAYAVVVSAFVVLGILSQFPGMTTIAENALAPAMFAVIAGSMALGVAYWKRIADRGLRRAMGVFFCLTTLFGPVTALELHRADIPALAGLDIFELFSTPLYFFIMAVLSIAFSQSYFKRPAYLQGDSLTPAFTEEYGLTSREAEVVERLAAGRSYKEIAFDLHISTKTVDNHLQSAYQKTRVNGRIQLVNLVNSNAAARVPAAAHKEQSPAQ
jgi:DNA-binding CsgD family transcriptional regulator